MSDGGVAPNAMLGQSVRRASLDRFTRGRGAFISDISVPGALAVAIARSPVAHAELISVDVSAARAAPGVVAVVTGADIGELAPMPAMWALPGQKYSDLRPLAEDRLRYAGQPYAAVIARSRAEAEAALSLIELRYAALPPILSVDAAMAPGAERIYPHWSDNIVASNRWLVGDADAGLAASATTIADRFVSQRVHALSIEPRGVIAQAEGDGALTIWSSTQSIHQVRSCIASCLNMPEHIVRVIAPDLGGSFGMKGNAYGEEVLLAWLARRLGRPVRWIERRSEAFAASVNGRDEQVDIEAGFDGEGRFTALKARLVLDKGGDSSVCSIGMAYFSGLVMTGGYHIPAIDIEAMGVLTNKSPTGAYRGYGQPEANLALERVMDLAAARLGLSPAEIRRRNFVPPDAMPVATATGLLLDSGRYAELMDATLLRFGYEDALARASRTTQEGVATGIGFAVYIEPTAFGPSEASRIVGINNGGFDVSTIRMEPSGHVRLFASQTPMGQGLETALAQLVANELALPVDDIVVSSSDTLHASYTAFGSGGSRGASVGGGSAVLAARELAGQIRRWGAFLLEAEADDIDLVQRGVQVRGDPTRRVAMSDLAAAAYFGFPCPPGMTPGLEARHAYDPLAMSVSYGAVAVEIEVDLDTGKIAVQRMTFGHDCGVQINPAIVDGQVIGGAAQGIGATLFEELRYDEAGRPLVQSLHDYLVPLASDLPTIDLLHLTTPSPFHTLGIKGVGETGVIAVPAAIMNAVQHAIGPQVRLTTLPLRAERLFDAIRAGVRPSGAAS
jgi:carbon-monoxide dehydrogenase large subunit